MRFRQSVKITKKVCRLKACRYGLLKAKRNSGHCSKILPIGVVSHEFICDKNNVPIDYKITEMNSMAEKTLKTISQRCDREDGDRSI